MAHEFEVRGIDKINQLLRPVPTSKKVMRQVELATGRNALIVLKAIRKGIQSGKYAANAALTSAIKGSTKPLADKGELFKSITIHRPKPTVAIVGILKTDGIYNVARAIHDGVQLSVTPKMRGLFFVLWLASQGSIPPGDLTGRARDLFDRYKKWKPLDDSTTAIRIPARRFIGDVFDNPGLRRKLKVNWKNAIRAGIIDAQKKG
jgi:hypothetical protein